MNRKLRNHFEQGYELYPVFFYVVMVIVGLAISCLALYWFIKYEDLSESDLITRKFTLVDAQPSDEVNVSFILTTSEVCKTLSIHSIYKELFQYEALMNQTGKGDTISCKIKKSDLHLLDSCSRVDIYELTSNNVNYLRLDEVIVHLRKNSTVMAPIVGICFMIISIYLLLIVIYGRKSTSHI